MKNKKLVSVNITTYNRASLLSRCLDSVLNQSYTNLEIVIVDDCSNDQTRETISKYQKRDKRIRYYKNNKNQGNAYSRNLALKYCNGFYVAFLDDDDEWIDKHKIKKQVKIFESNEDKKLGVVCSGILRVKKNGEEIIQKAYHPKDIKYKVLKGGLIHNSTAFTKKSIMLKIKGFDMNVSRGVDSEFFRRLVVIYNYNIFFMEDITCKYFENSTNRMSQTENMNGSLGQIKSQYFNIKKYFWYLLPRPRILFSRFYLLIYMQLKFLFYALKKFL